MAYKLPLIATSENGVKYTYRAYDLDSPEGKVWEAERTFRLDLVQVAADEFGITRAEVVSRYCDLGTDTESFGEYFEMYIGRSKSLAQNILKGLGDRYRADPSLDHLRQYLRANIVADLDL